MTCGNIYLCSELSKHGVIYPCQLLTVRALHSLKTLCQASQNSQTLLMTCLSTLSSIYDTFTVYFSQVYSMYCACTSSFHYSLSLTYGCSLFLLLTFSDKSYRIRRLISITSILFYCFVVVVVLNNNSNNNIDKLGNIIFDIKKWDGQS